MSTSYLGWLPKDVSRIIYRYLYDYVPLEILKQVRIGCGTPLKSSKCKLHKQPDNLSIPHNIEWKRSVFKPHPVCDKLIQSQDYSEFWNINFKSGIHRFSIINGITYHLSYTIESKRYKLIPYFQSDHCWQDLALRFIRNNRKDNSEDHTREFSECIQKKISHDAHIRRSQNKGSVESCVVC